MTRKSSKIVESKQNKKAKFLVVTKELLECAVRATGKDISVSDLLHSDYDSAVICARNMSRIYSDNVQFIVLEVHQSYQTKVLEAKSIQYDF